MLAFRLEYTLGETEICKPLNERRATSVPVKSPVPLEEYSNYLNSATERKVITSLCLSAKQLLIITITPRIKLTVNVTKRKLKQWVDSFKFL